MDKKKRIGQFIEANSEDGSYKSYVPKPLPPTPPLDQNSLNILLERTSNKLGELNALSKTLPNLNLLSDVFLKKEAVTSSQIEGTQSDLTDFLIFQSSSLDKQEKENNDDNIEIKNYTDAMYLGLKTMDELPLSRRLICKVHKQLLKSGRGSSRNSGEFRKVQNWIGVGKLTSSDTVFIPPPPTKLDECFSEFESFVNDYEMPTLLKTALAHVQFETLHPFLDGNGRLGRLLIIFMLVSSGLLKVPLLYLSLYFKSNKEKYYQLLQDVREKGDWEEWVEFFLEGILDTSEKVLDTSEKITSMFERDEEKYKNLETPGVTKTFESFKKNPIQSPRGVKESTNLSYSTVLNSLKTLEKLKIISETTKKHNNKRYMYDEYISIINEGTEIV